jgi:Short C-terminal domain
MMMRRRPLLRAAAIGGTAYAVGRHQGRGAEAQDQNEANQNQQMADLQAQQQAAPAAAAPAAATGYSDDSLDQLNKLGAMHKSGVLTDEEFEAAKAKILGV